MENDLAGAVETKQKHDSVANCVFINARGMPISFINNVTYKSLKNNKMK